MSNSICPSAPSARRIVLAVIVIALCLGGASAAQQEMVWVTMERDLFDGLVVTPAAVPQSWPPVVVASNAGVVMTRVAARDVGAMAGFLRAPGRIGGFIVHDSYEEAAAALEAVRGTRTYKALPVDFQIDEQVLVNQLLPQLDKTNVFDTMDHLSTAYVNRYYQYASGEQAALWIRDQWQGYATGRSDVTVTTYPHGGFVQPSVVLTIDGATLPSEVIVLGAHLDSTAGSMSPSTPAPGADDDASGVAVLSEVVRVLMANGVTTDRTMKFMAYAGEEGGLLGSGDIAQDHLDAGTNVVGMIQFDMTDYFGSVEDVALVGDYTSTELSAFLGELIDEYQPSLLWTYTSCGYGCSDHASWHNRGYPATFPVEAKVGEHNPYIHTANDTLASLGNSTDHALKFAKLALSFAIETGLADCTPAPVADAGPDQVIDEGDSTTIGTPAQPDHTYLWSPGGETTAEILVSPTETTVYIVTATTSCGSDDDAVTVTVVPGGQNGPQDAVYDPGLGAPKCAVAGSECDSLALLDGRDGVGPEPNQPNTLDGCTDGTSGSYHSDESNDAIVVKTLDGLDFTEGATVQVDATVYAWSTGSSDYLDLYYAADATSPTWVFITTINAPTGGLQTLSAQYTLPEGGLQAVRANFRYTGSASPCSTGSYDDHDDLVFAVKTGAGCTGDPQCDDGLWCNGAETCNLTTGQCEAGTPVDCDDGVACTDDSCNETTDSCDYVANDANCTNGLFCDGAETCHATLGCQAGTAPDCDDGVGCTVDSCNETTDQCDNTPDDGVCSNGLFCDGAEYCDSALDCQDGPDPCTGSQTCDEVNDVCEGGGDCTHSADFESGAGGWTNGDDTCTTGFFVVGTPDATDWQVGGGNPANAYYTQPNPGGVGSDDVDGGTCEALSPTVDCNGQPAAEVVLDYFHGQRDAGDDAGDGFTIEVLSDGVVVDTIVSVGDVTHAAAWSNASTIITSPGNLQLRVRATDAAGGGDIVEGGIDNVRVSPTTVPSCVVDDDFEGGAPGWGDDPASTCTSGDYVVGNPTNPSGGYQIVGSHSGTRSLFTAVNTSAGVDDVDGGNCILGSPTWSVPNASTLSVWYWHGQRDAGDDAAGDFFSLEYSTNGGSSWTTLASNGDATSNPTWLNATASIPAGSDVKLRVRCSDGPSAGDLVECGIDDFSICE